MSNKITTPCSQISGDRLQNQSGIFKNAKVTTKNVYSHNDSCNSDP